MIVSPFRRLPPLSASSCIPSCTNRSTLSAEKPSTLYATWPTTRWSAVGRGTHCRLRPSPCVKEQILARATARSVSSPVARTLSWISRRMQFSGCFRTVCKIDRASRCVPRFLHLAETMTYFFFPAGPACGTSSFRFLSHILRSTPSRAFLIAHVPDARHAPVPLPRPSAKIPDHPHPSYDLTPATIRSAPPCPTLLSPCLDHTLGRFRPDADGGEALPGDAELHVSTHAERGPRRRRRAGRRGGGGAQGRARVHDQPERGQARHGPP